MSVLIKPTPCPHCGRIMVGCMAASSRALHPTPGAVNICAMCAGISRWEDDMTLRKLTLSDLNELAAYPKDFAKILLARDLIRAHNEAKDGSRAN